MSVQTTSRPVFVNSGSAADLVPDGTITLQLGSGAPGVTVPVQVTHQQIRDLQQAPSLTIYEKRLVSAYAGLYFPAQQVPSRESVQPADTNRASMKSLRYQKENERIAAVLAGNPDAWGKAARESAFIESSLTSPVAFG